MNFQLLGELSTLEVIAAGNSINELTRLRRAYGPGRWRKMKGIGTIRLANGRVVLAEITGMRRMGLGAKNSRLSAFLSGERLT